MKETTRIARLGFQLAFTERKPIKLGSSSEACRVLRVALIQLHVLNIASLLTYRRDISRHESIVGEAT